MARISFDGFDEVAKMLQKEADRAKRNGAAALQAGAEVAKAAMMEKVAVADDSHGHSGHLKDHIMIGDVTYTEMDGYSVDIYPDGIRDDGQRYATVGFVLEYGRSDMRPRPWMRPAMRRSKKEIQEAIVKELSKD